jgi:hypothetical protein
MNAVSQAPQLVNQDAESLPKSRRALLRLEAFLERTFLIFCLYVLALGPLYWEWFAGKYLRGSMLLAAFYEPLWVLANSVPWLGRIINWYLWLWIC